MVVTLSIHTINYLHSIYSIYALSTCIYTVFKSYLHSISTVSTHLEMGWGWFENSLHSIYLISTVSTQYLQTIYTVSTHLDMVGVVLLKVCVVTVFTAAPALTADSAGQVWPQLPSSAAPLRRHHGHAWTAATQRTHLRPHF